MASVSSMCFALMVINMTVSFLQETWGVLP
jgi:hypothetical protein